MRSWLSPRSKLLERPTFNYEPLHDPADIRLVQIHPNANRSAEIACTLLTTNVPSLFFLEYDCLSYVWGPPAKERRIVCGDGTLQVTENLFVALTNLRGRDEIITIWIDQLCINQADVVERSRQVLLMADIYRHANKTIVWLGEAADKSDSAMKMIQNTRAITSAEYAHLLESENNGPNEQMETLMEFLRLPDLGHKSWTALRYILQRPWFKRSWVIQEVVVSANPIVRCGSLEVSLERFWMAAMPLESVDSQISTTSPAGHVNLASSRLLGFWFLRFTYFGFDKDNVKKQHHGGTSGHMHTAFKADGGFYNMLVSFSKTYQATDPRDKVYAFLGLQILQDVVPDYDVSPEIIYTQCASSHIMSSLGTDKSKLAHIRQRKDHNTRIMGLLYSAGTMNQSLLRLPSWVPDLSVEHYMRSFWQNSLECSCSNEAHRIYSAGGRDELAQIELLQGSRVRLPAKYFDLVSEAGAAEYSQLPPHKLSTATIIAENLRSWMQESSSIAQRGAAIYPVYPTGESMQHAFQRTVIANANDEGHDATPQEVTKLLEQLSLMLDHPSRIDFFFRYYSYGGKNRSRIDHSLLLALHLRPLTSVAHGRVFIRTEKGYYGVAPRGVKAGDCIVVVPGGCTPMVLRKAGHGLEGSEFQFLGDCYVHGIMKGEVIGKMDIPMDDVILR